jgi:hypothetical protein
MQHGRHGRADDAGREMAYEICLHGLLLFWVMKRFSRLSAPCGVDTRSRSEAMSLAKWSAD